MLSEQPVTENFSETQVPMTDADRHFLRWSRYQQILAYTAFGAFLTGFVFIPVDGPSFPIKVIIAASVFVAYFTLIWFWYRRMMEVYRGDKTVIKGVVTKKWIRTGSDYGLTIGSLEVSVPHEVYVKYQARDGIELHRFTKWGIFVVQHHHIPA